MRISCKHLRGSNEAAKHFCKYYIYISAHTAPILLTKTTAVQDEAAPSYHRLRGLYFLAVVFAATIDILSQNLWHSMHKSHTFWERICCTCSSANINTLQLHYSFNSYPNSHITDIFKSKVKLKLDTECLIMEKLSILCWYLQQLCILCIRTSSSRRRRGLKRVPRIDLD